ncbi:putative sulfate exporter family transporter [Nonomuraea sp. NBC_01738]|uniref:YeiH family protein n=1 Tax=Nonomuraea sp. NBC_01738 TaxID=2976003 RepID=UPI002E161557|nr:putative sulfate exporter family transporter [Nonomuraea sp. NBC_01738]
MVSLPVTGSWPRLHLPGILVASIAVAFALVVSRFVPAVSPAIIAVTAGATLANLGWLSDRLRPGLTFVSKKVLRAAIVLLGLQIAVPQVLSLGRQTLLIVVVATGVTFAVTPLIGRRLGLPEGASLLIATGVSICGAAAIAAMNETGGSDDDDVAGALSVVTLYGTAAIVIIPLLASWLGLSGQQLGVWTGASVHEVAQVAAIGAASGAAVLTVAVTVKLARVVLLAPLVAITSFRKRSGRPITATAKRPPILPLFVVGFLVMVAVRSLGLVPEAVTGAVPIVTNLLLAAALFGLGTGIDVRKLMKGGKTLLLGAVATLLVGGISLAGVALLVP